ncbi:hybrid sensor histidine kinase/response regulator [Janthinobacterium svalbardensis]|uniref:histidine kinase n=1 Tax=Janthinobacterium svalbardensis TaxID=368607 RepID=A0A290WWP5_9BURK|nr:ATP-binding protein [Janthinobacterium svalbardensis]ATD61294.1 hybrid sensor histidine kinase/response regulator [Janthinobacterium svalbardensis]
MNQLAAIIPDGQTPVLKTEALQKAIFDSVNFSYIATDALGIIQIFNVGAEHLLGYSAADVLNKLTPDSLADPQEIIARAHALSEESGQPVTPGLETLIFKASRGIEDIVELTYIRKDGSRFPAIVSVTALRDEYDAIIGYLLIGTDNTARQQIEQVLHNKTIELEKAKAAAEKANLAKSEFLSSMSHELRTPLNAVLGFAQLMETATPLPTPAQKMSIEQILKGGWYLLRLINEILDLATIESGKLMMSLEAMALNEVLADCQLMIAPQAQTHGIELLFPPAGMPMYIDADRTRIKQVMINLLSNAIKYNRPGGSVSVTCAASAGRVRVSVSDTGIGLSKQQQAQLFQPFNRLGQEAGNTEGTGIGLVVTKQLVELMGGRIGVESNAGAGSTFWFELDASSAPPLTAAGASAATSARSRRSEAAAEQRTLLYVEDNEANVNLVEQLIERRDDLNLLVAVNGLAGVDVACKQLPDVILMDINLPGISGIEALKILRANPLTAHIPVMALTANAVPHDIELGMKAGFFRYLTKPIKIDEFMESLNMALDYADEQL